MMKFQKGNLFYLLSIFVAFCFLFSCAHSKIQLSENLQKGKLDYERGYYKEAFRELLPLAADGKPEAEYAVGYMYYYGYGTPQDVDTGYFWIEKAANQHYQPAVKALPMLGKKK